MGKSGLVPPATWYCFKYGRPRKFLLSVLVDNTLRRKLSMDVEKLGAQRAHD